MDYIRVIVLLTVICLRNICGFDIIELNHDLGPHSPFFPLPVNTTFKSTVQEAGYSRRFWLAYSEITTQQFISTHVCAPYSLYEFGITIDQIPFRDLFPTAAVIDVRDKVVKNHFYQVTIEDVENWIQENGMFPQHCIVIFNTGWDIVGRYPDMVSYFGSADDLTKLKYPGVMPETIQHILSYEQTHGIHFVGTGIDAPALDNFLDQGFVAERMTAERNKYFVGNLKDLNKLPPKGSRIMVMPLKLRGGEAAPARVAANLPPN